MAPLTGVLPQRYSPDMLWAVVFWLLVSAVWAFIHKVTTPQKDVLASALWLGAITSLVMGVIVEVILRGGRLPVSW